ncbi:hypothetical protein [Lysobacter changpingensis]|jgi:hypothetical protein|uniref:hypothetical protein n=1 Tax=Lysobacter changpingensis TaxID=2792784 RepID=UPI001A8F01EE|nr:hypothetical protein [Lysobacter changpingensis]
MKTIPSALAVAAVAALTFAAGCSTSSAMQASVSPAALPADDGVLCPDQKEGKGGPTVYVDVKYAADGTPSAEPNKCFIDSGTIVVWRDPPDRTTMFNLVFSERRTGRKIANLRSAKATTRYKLSSEITGNPGDEIKYGIQANGKTVDPAVIIK